MTTTNDTPATERAPVESDPADASPLPSFVDWVIGAVIALGGLLSLVGGSAVVSLVGREQLAEGISEGTVTVTVFTEELTEAETLDLAEAVTTWVGAGLLVTGAAMVLFAVGYVAVRHRARSRTDGQVSTYSTHALLGAITAAVLSFLPFSPAAGGALAGYLEQGHSDRTVSVGAVGGFLAVVPFLAVLASGLGGTVAGLSGIGRGELAAVAGATTVFALAVVAAIGAGLGALGGYVGGSLADGRA